jgi:hypothetical protein
MIYLREHDYFGHGGLVRHVKSRHVKSRDGLASDMVATNPSIVPGTICWENNGEGPPNC